MKLREWVKAERGRSIRLAETVGVQRSYITHLIRPGRYPGRSLAVRIEEATNGEVTRHELLWPEEENDG